MDSINTYLTKIDENINNFKHDDIQPYVLEYKRMNIFNNNIKRPSQKIWLLTPKLKMLGKIYIPNNKKQVALLSLILYEQDNEINKFKEFIEKLESYITSIIHDKHNDELILKSCIKKCDTFFPSLTIQLPFINKDSSIRFNFDIYNANNKKIQYDEIDSGSFIRAYIELSDIWISGKEYGINWKVLQMKAYPEFDFTTCLFDDGPKQSEYDEYFTQPKTHRIPAPPKINTLQNQQLPIPLPPSRINKPEIKNDQNQLPPFIPTAQELTNMLVKLKKVQKEDDNIIIINNDTVDNKTVSLPKKEIPKKKPMIKKKIIKKPLINN
jgi:hypothetical protein